MKLIRLGEPGNERPAVLVDADTYVDVSDEVADYDEAFFGSGGLARLADVVASRVASGEVEPLGGQRIGAPIARPHQILCIGLNYSDHAAETGQRVPAEPILFTKSPNTLIGPNDDVRIPRGSTEFMIFDPLFLVHYLSQFLVLEPGDLINTGTPPGVGMGMQPPQFLQPGDVIELGVDGLGTQRQRVVGPR